MFFKDVTQAEFFAALYADKRDIMPSNRLEHETRWETKARELWGVTTPGWKNPGGPKSYRIVALSTPEG